MTAEQLKALLRLRHWKEDGYGHLKKLSPGVKNGERVEVLLRVKFQKLSVRLERQVDFGNGNEWVKVSSCYLKDAELLSDGKIKLGGRLVAAPKPAEA